ncbi:MAG: leucine-rich repeat protein, partial [Paludibacteraceae bacterium]|nr:leucine-rich repeat protein [Paludibacteraceae bacterium]
MINKFLALTICSVISFCGYAENLKTIKTSKPGTLSTKISEKKLAKVTDLSISGPINKEDVAYLRSVLKKHKIINTLNLKSAVGLDEIMDGGFAGCSSIYAIILPSTVKSIGQSAFEDCNEL